MSEPDIIWRETWPGEDIPHDISGSDRGRRIGRVYADSAPRTGERMWRWFRSWGGVDNSGIAESRRGAMMALEDRYTAALAERGAQFRELLPLERG